MKDVVYFTCFKMCGLIFSPFLFSFSDLKLRIALEGDELSKIDFNYKVGE